MKFGKGMIEEIESIELVLENCECYDIPASDVMDFWTDEVKKGPGEYGHVDDGGLRISKNAFHLLSNMAKASYADGTTALDHEPEEIFYLSNRIIDCCDICQIEVKFKDGCKILFFVPYDPLESNLNGGEIDLSNCPSAELDENGDMLVLFGESSHAYRRVDNNYSELIIGIGDIIKKPLSELQVKIEKFINIDYDCRCPKFFIEIELKNRGYSGKKVELVFEDVQKVNFEISFYNEKRSIWMSRISTGEIYVEIENFCSFCCHAIKTYAAYIGRADDSVDYKDEDR